MVNCSYCSKELERQAYCNASHKVMYYRQLSKGKQTKYIVDDKITDSLPKDNTMCKHGSRQGLCKHGC